MYHAFDEYEWHDTGNEVVIAIAELGGNQWLGAVAEWLDFCSGEPGADKPHLAFFAQVEADDFEAAYDRLMECTDGDVVFEVGWFRTSKGAEYALKDEAGIKYL